MQPLRRAQHHAERLGLVLLAVLLAFQPAFAIRLTCTAVGQLFPSRCCCLVEKLAEPSCCSAAEPDDASGPVATSELRDCDCAMEFPAAPRAAHEVATRSADLDLLAAARTADTRVQVFLDGLCAALDARRGPEPPGRGSGPDGLPSCAGPADPTFAHGLAGHLAHLQIARC